MANIITNNRDRSEFKIRTHFGLIGKSINEKRHEDHKRVDLKKNGIVPFKFLNKNKEIKESNECEQGEFYIGDIKVSPGSGKWCATKLDKDGFLIEWGYCINLNNEIKTLEKAIDIIKNLQDLNRSTSTIIGYLKTFIIDLELRSNIFNNEKVLELLRNKNIFPDVSKYKLGDEIIVKDKVYILKENLELGGIYWSPKEIIVPKKIIKKVQLEVAAEPKEKYYGTNKDQQISDTIRSYQGIILENVNRAKRGSNRIEKTKECIYPFDYINKNNKRVSSKSICVDRDMTFNGTFIGPEGGKWCATELDDTGLMREWGYCTKDIPGQDLKESNNWEKLCNAVQYEQWSNVSKISHDLLLEGYSERTIINSLLQNCNRKFISPHFEKIKRLINVEYIKIYPWTLTQSVRPVEKYLKLKDNISEIIKNKLEYLENGIGLNLKSNLASEDNMWLLHYYYLVERLIIINILSETGEFDGELLEKIKKIKDIKNLNRYLIKLEKFIKSKLKDFVEVINKSENVSLNFNNRPSELNSDINDDIFITNASAFFGTIQKERRIIYFDKLDLKKNIVEQLVLYNKSFIEPKEAEEEPIIKEEEEELEKEMAIGQSEWSNSNSKFYSNYPELNDPDFYIRIQRKKEFKMNKMSKWSEKDIKELCRIDTFELSTQQQWVANFFNPDTPYKGLLLYWGTGVGKTCASITIAEKHLDYYKKYNKKILIILGTSTLENYKKELYNFKKEQIEIKKGLIPGSLQCTKDRYWMPIDSNDPISLKKREAKIIKKIEQDYEFITYGSLKGIIKRQLLKRGIKLDVGEDKKLAPKELPKVENEMNDVEFIAIRNQKGNLVWKKSSKIDPSKEERMKLAISEYFGDRLVIIDEIQNIRTAEEGGDQIAPQMLEKIIHYSDNIKLVMMSATPMFNNATEIIYILNLLLDNDKRDKIKNSDLFDSKDNLINPKLLYEVSRGYISYVRGANPVSFPRKLLPNESPIEFIKDNNPLAYPHPEKKMNGEELNEDEVIQYNPLVLCNMSPYQEYIYKKAILGEIDEEEQMADIANETFDIKGKMICNIVYPSKDIISKVDITTLYGDKGFDRCFIEDKNRFIYNEDNALEKEVPFLDQSVIQKYSPKFKKILDNVMNTENGIIFIYSEYKKGGSIPLALMLEQNGFEQLVVEGKYGDSRVKNRLESKLKRPLLPEKWKYVLLDGDLEIKKRQQIIDKCNSEENKNGNIIKVIIGTRVASEGVDFSRIRQVHILNPWANFSRIDQVIGRGIRNCSHKDLPEEDRNVTVFLYSSHLKDNSIETTDEKVHRRAEKKDIQMKEVEFVLRNNAIDCGSNFDANKYTKEEFGEVIGDKDNTRDCGYKDCNKVYQCVDITKIRTDKIDDQDTYNIEIHANREINNYKKLIKELFEISVIYTLNHIRDYIKTKIENYEEDIFLIALDKMIQGKEKIHDKYQRLGRVAFRNGYYLFQPIELDKTKVLPEYYRSNPLTLKPSKVEIKYKISGISDDKINKWIKDIKELILEIDDEDELSYTLDRVKDVVMKQLILEWFNGEYDESMIEDEDIQDKIRNYLNEKDVIIMDENKEYPKAIHWTKQLSYEYMPDTGELIEHIDGERFKKETIRYNFNGYPLDSHVIGRLEKVNDGKEEEPLKEMVFKIIDFSFVENKSNLKLDGKACMNYTKAPMNKLLENLEIDYDKNDKRSNLCRIIEISLRKYNREHLDDRIWWIESNKFYTLEKII